MLYIVTIWFVLDVATLFVLCKLSYLLSCLILIFLFMQNEYEPEYAVGF